MIDEKQYNAKIVHCVHDEVVIEASKEITEEVVPEVEDCLCKAFKDFFNTVPIKTDTAVKPHWSK